MDPEKLAQKVLDIADDMVKDAGDIEWECRFYAALLKGVLEHLKQLLEKPK